MRQKILFIANSWLQDIGGGGVKSTVTKLLNNFPKDLFDFSFLDIEIGADSRVIKTGHSELNGNIEFTSVYLPNIKFNRLYIPLWSLFIFRIFRVIQKEKPALLCYVTGPSLKIILFFWTKLFFPKIRQVFIEHIPPLFSYI
ncbi:MAG: hypothetical protein Q8N90_02295 [bacterium]|nr:hypothetical protein [bacterium]